jgi:hypothetical protein
MKNISLLLFIVACSFSISATAQSNNRFKKITATLGGGPANHRGAVGGFELQGVFKSNLSSTISFHSISMDAKNEPSDYQPASLGLIIISIPDSYEPQLLNTYTASVGKYFSLERNVWITTEAGVSIVNGYEYKFTRQNVETDSWGGKSSNYKVDRVKATGAGGMLKADLTWAFCPVAGLGFEVFTNFNSVQSATGAEFKLVFGWMNKGKKPVKSVK